MKTKLFSFIFLFVLAPFLFSQFSTGTVTLPSTGITIKIDTDPSLVTLTLTGDKDSWLGIGFNGGSMAETNDTFIYCSATALDYHIIGYTNPVEDASQDWTIVSNTISGATRTIVATRTLTGNSGEGDYTFTNSTGTLPIIAAKGLTLELSKHTNIDSEALEFSGQLNTSDKNIAKDFIIVPNPAKDIVKIETLKKINQIKIYDFSGKLLKHIVNFNNDEVNVSSLREGIYFMEIITDDDKKFYEKVLKK